MQSSVMNLVSLVFIMFFSISASFANPIPVEYVQSTQPDAISECYTPPKKEKHHQEYATPVAYGSDQGPSSIIIDEKLETSDGSDETVQSTLDSTLELDSNTKQKLTKEKWARPQPFKRS